MTLRQFAAQSGDQLLYSTDDVGGVQTRAVHGEFTPIDALAHMLEHTPLKARQDEKTNAISVTTVRPSRAPPAKTPAPPAAPSEKPAASPKTALTQPNPSHSVKSRNILTLLTAWLAVSVSADALTTDEKSKDVYVLDTFKVQSSFASSLAAAAGMKETTSGITENIAAEDFGKLPDVSIADALARLPGLTSQRVSGRDQQITIRGFSPDFSIGTLNGVEQATTSNNRAVEYDQYPSELIGGVTVHKTGQANLVGGLAGTINLLTPAPLSADHRVFGLSAYFNWTGYPQLTPGVKKAGESFSVSYVDLLANGTEGIYLGYAHAENPYAGKRWQSWGPGATDASGNITLGGMVAYAQAELLKRDSFVGVLESKPSEAIHSKVDLFFSSFDDNQLLRGFTTPIAWGASVMQPGYTVKNGQITNYTLTNVQPVIESLGTHTKDHDASAIWSLELGKKSEWPVNLLAGVSTAKSNQRQIQTYAGLGFAQGAPTPDTWVISDPAGPNPPQISAKTNYADASLFTITDPQGWGTWTHPATGQEGYVVDYIVKDIADSIKLSTRHELNHSIFRGVEAGVSYAERFKQWSAGLNGTLVNSNGKGKAPLPSLLGTTDLTFIGNLHPISWDSESLFNSGALSYLANTPDQFAGDFYKIWEKVTRPYVNFDLKGKAFGVPFSGDIGAVANIATQNSTGLASSWSNGLIQAVAGGATYADVLPSLNLTFKPTSQDYIRVFIGRQEQRPRMYDMRAARIFAYNAANASSTTNSPWSGSSGNPGLKPWIADSIDLGFEHYFAKSGGYVSLAFFEKHLLSYIYQQATVTDFAGYPYTGAQAPVLTKGITTQFSNGQGGNVSGMELTLQLTSEALSGGAIKGFGVVLNGLLVNSNIQPWGPGNGSAPLPNMSKKTANATLYYEAHGFSVRVSAHYQSQTRDYIYNFGIANNSGFGTPNDGYSEELPFTSIDAQVSYAFSQGPLKGLSLYLEGRNLNNASTISYFGGDSRQLANWQQYGAAYRTGLNYKF